ncbi:MAG TPA: hypothetical protein VGH22_01565 [Candidatus Binatia bacterium]
MISVKISLIVFAWIFGGAALGILLHAVLPQDHLSAESKDIVKLGMGLVGTMAALVLGLLVASAKSSYDTQSAEVTQLTSNVALLDRILAHYGPETKGSRNLLRETVARVVSQIWVEEGASTGPNSPQSAGGEVLYDKIQALAPKDDAQRSLKSQALTIVMETGKLRQLMFTQGTAAVSVPLLVVLVLWLTIIFISFGLFAPFNATVVSSLFLSALSVSGAIFLIRDMYTPYTGVIGISSAPLQIALAQLAQ